MSQSKTKPANLRALKRTQENVNELKRAQVNSRENNQTLAKVHPRANPFKPDAKTVNFKNGHVSKKHTNTSDNSELLLGAFSM